MGFYDDMAAIALELLAEFGAAAVLTKRVDGAYDETTGKRAIVATNYNVLIAFKAQPEMQAGNSGVALRSKEAIIGRVTDAAGNDVPIDAEDNITVAGVNYKVINPGPIAPAGITVAYDAVVEA